MNRTAPGCVVGLIVAAVGGLSGAVPAAAQSPSCTVTFTAPAAVVLIGSGASVTVHESDTCAPHIGDWSVTLTGPDGRPVWRYRPGQATSAPGSLAVPGTFTFVDAVAADAGGHPVPATAPGPVQARDNSFSRLASARRDAGVVTVTGSTGQKTPDGGNRVATLPEGFSLQYLAGDGVWRDARGARNTWSKESGRFTVAYRERFAHPRYRIRILQTPTVAASVSSAAAPRDITPAGVSNCGQDRPVIDRATFTVTCGDGGVIATRVRWTTATHTRGKAVGILVENDCAPSCAQGHDHSYPATLTFRRVVLERGRPAFTWMDVVYTRQVPAGSHRRGTTYDIS